MRRTALLLLLLPFFGQLYAAVEVDSIEIGFKQSHIDFDRSIDRNGERIDSLISIMRADSIARVNRRLRSIEVVGAASPEGSVRFNQYLSEQRAATLFNIFRDRGLIGDSAVSFTYLGRDWGGLRKMVEADGNVPSRDKVLGLLTDITDRPGAVSHPLNRLKSIGDFQSYLYLYNNIFPALRRSTLVITYDERPIFVPFPAPRPAMEGAEMHPAALPFVPVEPEQRKPFYMAIKTNMLYDAALLPNVGAEFYLGKNWSVFGDWMYGWWDKDSRHFYWRAYGGTLGVRRWFGRAADIKPLTGHHAGLFAGAVTFDFELGGRGYMGGIPRGTIRDRALFIAGIEYGYSLPVTRRLNIDFTIGLGYLGGKVIKYSPYENFYRWESTERLNWVGPTKLEVALVWLIGYGNVNRKGVEL